MRLMKEDRREVIPMDTNEKPMAKPRRRKPLENATKPFIVTENLPGSSESLGSTNQVDVVEAEKRPVPKPRPKPRVDLAEESEPLPACFLEERRNLSVEDKKRMTINLFGRKLVDPFDADFEDSLKDASLTTISTTPEDGRNSTSDSDENDNAGGEENPLPPRVWPQSVPAVVSYPNRDVTAFRNDEIHNNEQTVIERESVYETISSYSSSESGISEAGRARPLSRVSNFGGSKNSVRSEGDRPPPIPPLNTKPTANGSAKPLFTIIPPTASPSSKSAFINTTDVPSSASENAPLHTFNRQSFGVQSNIDVKVLHPYDEVAIEDGIVTVDGVSPSRPGPGLCGSSENNTDPRKLLLEEFDPLLSHGTSTYEDIDDGEFDSLIHVNPAEVEPSESDIPLGTSLTVQNPEYLPVQPGSNNIKDSIPSFANFEETPVASDQQHEEVYEPVNVQLPSILGSSEEDAGEVRLSCTSSVFTEGSPPPPSPDNSGENQSPNTKNSFLGVTWRTIRRIPTIREELRPASTTAAESLRCSRCLYVHPDSRTSRCKFVPTPRENIVYSSLLYKQTGLAKKDFVQRWTYLAKGDMNFLSRSANANPDKPTETIKLDKVVMITKKEDQKVGEAQYKCFQLYLGNGKHSTVVLAGATEKERSNWMQKYIEAFTSNFPNNIITSYDRAGWCFVKENTTGAWQPSWLVLSERKLFYSFVNTEEYFQLDLRKVRELNLGTKDSIEYQCPFVENKDVLTVHMITKILYVQTESTKLTANWEKALRAAALYNGTHFEEMQLTTDDVPVIVHKCIDFLYAHGLLSEGIYRQSGANSRIAGLLEDFKKDAWAVQMSPKDYSAHDVAGALKRYFRTLPEPLVTERLYPDWISAYGIKSRSGKMEQYVNLLKQLPPINYNILKKLICHLHAVHELQENNLMPLDNLAPIWGPTLMSVDEGVENTSKLVQSYEIACAQCGVVRDLIENYYTLFQVDSQEIDRERKIQEGLEKFHLGAVKRKVSGDMRIYVYLHERDENSAISITLSPSMTAASIVEHICKTKLQHKKYENLALHEVILNKCLERPIYPTEKVADIISTWSKWGVEESKSNYLILRTNTLYPVLIPYARDPAAVFGEFKYADSKSKSFRKYSFEFSGAKLKYLKDSKEVESWNIEDITWYIGHESRRTPPCKYNLTFAPKSYDFKRSKEEPYFGNILSMNDEEERHKFIAAMIIGEVGSQSA